MVEKMFSEIEQELKERYPDFGEKAVDEFRGALRDLQDRISSIELSYVCNLELKPMPMLIITLEDGTQRFLIYDPFYEEVFEETDFYSSYSSLSEMLCLDSLDPEIDCFELPYREVEELRHYGNRFAVIFEDEDEYVKVHGVFLDKVIEFEAPYGAFNNKFESKVIDIIKEIKDVLRTYSWHPVDPWRGYYEGAKSAGGFVKVVEGWIGLGSGDPSVERLAKVSKLEEEPPCTPILFVFPRSSNVCVTYFDVYVRKSDVEKFKNWFGDVDRFSFSEGINIRTTYDSA